MHLVHSTALVCKNLYLHVTILNREEMVVLLVYQVGVSVLCDFNI